MVVHCATNCWTLSTGADDIGTSVSLPVAGQIQLAWYNRLVQISCAGLHFENGTNRGHLHCLAPAATVVVKLHSVKGGGMARTDGITELSINSTLNRHECNAVS
jgi:hypothetical protein